MTIHSEHPFQPPEDQRNPLRRLRGRLPSPVSLWTSGHGDARTGLTVSSTLVADGEPGVVVGIIDPLADVWDTIAASGAAVVTMLSWGDRQLADVFGYVAPAPGGPFTVGTWTETEWGPVLDGASAWAGCRLRPAATQTVGWGLLVQLEIHHVEVGPEAQPLVHRRGRYSTF